MENQVGNVREWLFTPQPRLADFTELNAWLARRCVELAGRRHPVETECTVADCFAEEQPLLRPITAAYIGYVERTLRVSSTCLIRLDRNRYSVPALDNLHFFVTDLTRLERRVFPLRQGDTDLLGLDDRFFRRWDVTRIPLAGRVFDLATELQAAYPLKTPDALHLAGAISAGCDEFLTNDQRLAGTSRRVRTATGIGMKSTPVTHNTRQFSRIDGLQFTDWEF